ncbi:MAG: DUF2130 domain-containing protein, partial [Isosphaeraceae bacterium]
MNRLPVAGRGPAAGTVGSILWETKRTKAWSNGWVTKLKDDAGKVSASESIIVS